ncbi:MAG: hypothetical protein ACRDG5_08575 [Anaerolineales bacterium]
MLSQGGTPDTFGYMLLGFGAILGLLGAYIVSLIGRARSLEQDRGWLEKIGRDKAAKK